MYTDKEFCNVLGISINELQYIDKGIKDILYLLNSKGYVTKGSCEGHVDKTLYDDRVYISIAFDKNYNFNVLPPTIERKGNKMYGKLHKPTKYGSINTGLYYATSRKTSNEQKEKERKELLEMIENWAKEL